MTIPTVPEEASRLLKQYAGVQRKAEEAAWGQQSKYHDSSEGYAFWARVAICIAEGMEVPKVERQAYIPTPAFRPGTVIS